MASSLANLRSDLRTQLKIDPNGKIWNDSALNGYINDAHLQVQRDGDFSWKENITGNFSPTMVVGTAEYALPDDFVRVLQVMINGGIKNVITKQEAKRRDGINYPIQSGEPSNYYINGNFIGLWPVPNAIKPFSIDYKKKMPSLDSDSETIDFNTDYDSAIANYAAYLAWSGYRGASAQAQVELTNYQRIIDVLKQSYLLFAQENLKFGLQRSQSNFRDDFPYNSNI